MAWSENTLIVGGGLAGLCAARSLANYGPVRLVDSSTAASGASASALAGLVTPLSGRWAKPVWQIDEALAGFETLISDGDEAVVDRIPGVYRPAGFQEQADRFKDAAGRRPDLASWWEPASAAERIPWIHAPLGMLVLLRGAAIAVPSLMRRIEADALDRGAHSVVDWTLTGWDEDPEGVTARFETPDGPAESRANRLILALGPGFLAFETLRSLRLHCVKGQLVRVRSDATPAIMRAVSSNGYVVPQSDGSLVVGSTYEHTFPDGEPKRIVSHNLLSMAETALPWIRGAEILEEAAGIRVTVPGIRLPMVGPLPGHARTWVLTGLGSKGLLMAPYIAERLHGWLQDPASIPSDLRVRTDDS